MKSPHPVQPHRESCLGGVVMVGVMMTVMMVARVVYAALAMVVMMTAGERWSAKGQDGDEKRQ